MELPKGIFKPKDFYDSYLIDYHKDKAELLMAALDNHPEVGKNFVRNSSSDEHLKKFKLMIRSEITQTYFQSIETLFSFIFILDTTKSKTFADSELLERLSNYDIKKLYSRITTIATTESGLNFLDKQISKKFKNKISRYIFYYGIDENSEIYKGVEESLEAIKYALKILAIDFNDRHQYNNIKHGVRMIQNYKALHFADPVTLEPKFTFDWSEAMTYIKRTNDQNKIVIVTKPFDSKRDYYMIHLVSNLISNIIECRRVSFYGETSFGKSLLSLTTFTKQIIDETSKSNETNITMTQTISLE